jgi:hypothetical protein
VTDATVCGLLCRLAVSLLYGTRLTVPSLPPIWLVRDPAVKLLLVAASYASLMEGTVMCSECARARQRALKSAKR